MKPPRKRTAERELQRRIRKLAERGLTAEQIFKLVAPEYQPSTRGQYK